MPLCAEKSCKARKNTIQELENNLAFVQIVHKGTEPKCLIKICCFSDNNLFEAEKKEYPAH